MNMIRPFWGDGDDGCNSNSNHEVDMSYFFTVYDKLGIKSVESHALDPVAATWMIDA